MSSHVMLMLFQEQYAVFLHEIKGPKSSTNVGLLSFHSAAAIDWNLQNIKKYLLLSQIAAFNSLCMDFL